MKSKDNIIISRNARIGKNVLIHPFVIINDGVHIQDNVEILPFTYLGKVPGWQYAHRKILFKKKIVIAKGCRIGPSVTIYYDVEIGKQSLICEGVSIREGSRIGSKCLISRNVTLNYNVRIGNETKILDSSHITGNTYIGDRVFISALVSTTNDRSFGLLAYNDKMCGPNIEDNVKIGACSSILPNVKIGKNSIITAGSIVKTNVPKNKIVSGNPAMIKGEAKRFMNIFKFIDRLW